MTWGETATNKLRVTDKFDNKVDAHALPSIDLLDFAVTKGVLPDKREILNRVLLS